MFKISTQILLLLLLVVCLQFNGAHRTVAKQQASLGWDLTYSSVLERNKIAHDEWIWKWLGQDYQSPIKKTLEDWKGESIVSSILIEQPDFHAGDHVTLWLVRTQNHAYYWQFAKGQPYRVKESVNPEDYDRLIEQMASWQQSEPAKPENTPVGGVPGYLGFLSLYDRGNSRQMLLSLNDFNLCQKEGCREEAEGRIVIALKMLKFIK